MCGRYFLYSPTATLQHHFQAQGDPSFAPRYNIAPSLVVPVVTQPSQGPRILSACRWGLVPSWASDPKIGFRMINARAETVAEKPSFRSALRYRRCLLPADGFYEWRRAGKKKQPFLFRLKTKQIFAMAGLWEHWEGKNGEVIDSCTIITTAANSLVQAIHERMPVILTPGHYSRWLDPTLQKPQALPSRLQPYPAEDMETFAVDVGVNNARNEGCQLIQRATPCN